MIAAPSFHALAAMAVTIAMFIGFARGKMSVEIISLLTIAVIAVGLYFFPLEGADPQDGLVLAFAGFGHYALITICALMVMGRGLVVTGALEPAARMLESVFKYNLQLGLLISLLIAFVLSMAINNTPVLVLLIPIFVTLAARGALPASKTLIPLNAASLLGGLATTIGTSTNILVVSIAVDLGMRQMGVFHFTPIVLLASAIALPYLWLVMPRLLRDNTVTDPHQKRRFHTRLRISDESVLAGKKLAEVAPTLPSDLTFHDTVTGAISPQQRLHVSGTHDALEEAMRTLGSEVAPSWVLDKIRRKASADKSDILVSEMAVTADSRLINRTLPSSGIADLFGVAVLGIHRPERIAGQRDTYSDGGDLRMAEGDVLLVEGNQRFSSAVKYLTQSTWSHAALHVGDCAPGTDARGQPLVLVEADLARGVSAAPLAKYAGFNTRICRPVKLTDQDGEKVAEFMVGKIGSKYDLKNVVDLARYLLPTPPVPVRFRRRMLAFGSGDPTRAICSTLIAQAFQSVQYPILPDIEKIPQNEKSRAQHTMKEVLHIRHHTLFAPRDFDISPYFAIVKPTIEQGFDYRQLVWSKEALPSPASRLTSRSVNRRLH